MVKLPFQTTSLNTAASGNDLETVKNLIRNPNPIVNINDYTQSDPFYALEWSARNGNLEMTQYLIENSEFRGNKQRSINNAVCMAARYGKLEIIKFLIEKSIDVNQALRDAIDYEHLEVIKYLIENPINKADIHVGLNWWGTFTSNKEIIKYLREKENC
jgi:ankyrin repeat protein